MVDWTQLLPELLQVISENINVYEDYINFRAVCCSWRASVLEIPRHLPLQIPWLLIHPNHRYSIGTFNASDDKIHFLYLSEDSHGQRRCGSSHGWVAILDETPTILLMNPITGATLRLPPLSTFPNVVSFDGYRNGREYEVRESTGEIHHYNSWQMRNHFINKIVLSSDPSNQNGFTAVALLGLRGNLAFCRSGEGSWSFVDDGPPCFEDIIYSESDGVFYAVDRCGVVLVIDLRDWRPSISIVAMESRFIWNTTRYLVKSGDELLLVVRYFDDIFKRMINDGWNWTFMSSRTLRFEVFRMEWKGTKWEKIERLDDKALFLGKNSSIAFSAADFAGISGNCIYYTDDYGWENFEVECQQPDVGIFRLGDENFEPLPYYSCSPSIMRPSFPPIWVSPNPC